MDQSMTGDYIAHGFCFMWDLSLVWLHVLFDVLTGTAYISIPPATKESVTRACSSFCRLCPLGLQR